MEELQYFTISNNHILLYLASFIPGMLYALIVYLLSPYKTISLKTTFYYMVIGSLSILFTQYFLRMFPDWQELMNLSYPGAAQLVLYFFQIAVIEEVFKYFGFKIVDDLRFRRNDKPDHPLATMFYCGVVGLSFAIFENVDYYLNAYHTVEIYKAKIVKLNELDVVSPFQLEQIELYKQKLTTIVNMLVGATILLRTFTSTILHMVAGLFMGYWIALSRIQPKAFGRSIIWRLELLFPRVRKVVYTIFGLITAVFIHGLYNYNISTESAAEPVITILILVGGLILTMQCGKYLTTKHNQRKTEELPPRLFGDSNIFTYLYNKLKNIKITFNNGRTSTKGGRSKKIPKG